MISKTLFAVSAAVLAAAGAAPSPEFSTYRLPGERAYPEGVAVDARSGNIVTASAVTGDIFLGPLGGGRLAAFVRSPGSQGSFGVLVLSTGGIAVARGEAGVVDVYTPDGTLRRRLRVEDPGRAFLNDLAELPDGRLVVTDSYRPVLYAAGATDDRLEAWIDFAGTPLRYEDGFNLNGVAYDPEADVLIAAQTNTSQFWRIDLATSEVREVATVGGAGGADGLRLIGDRLYAVQGDRVGVFDLDADHARAVHVGDLTSDAFDGPTAVAIYGGRAFVANAQLSKRGGAPSLPFEIVSVPLPMDLLPPVPLSAEAP